jgi:hypothetical protein
MYRRDAGAPWKASAFHEQTLFEQGLAAALRFSKSIHSPSAYGLKAALRTAAHGNPSWIGTFA